MWLIKGTRYGDPRFAKSYRRISIEVERSCAPWGRYAKAGREERSRRYDRTAVAFSEHAASRSCVFNLWLDWLPSGDRHCRHRHVVRFPLPGAGDWPVLADGTPRLQMVPMGGDERLSNRSDGAARRFAMASSGASQARRPAGPIALPPRGTRASEGGESNAVGARPGSGFGRP